MDDNGLRLSMKKVQRFVLKPLYLGGRSEVIRTPDFFVPNEALYQTEPHPDI